jgi:hypothetical protein
LEHLLVLRHVVAELAQEAAVVLEPRSVTSPAFRSFVVAAGFGLDGGPREPATQP